VSPDDDARERVECDRIGHVSALEGIRGIAIAAVLLTHVYGLRGGYLGVGVFFVLSGF
jgi:peptidoglycan/LPS O-acetylase OafA/YrhL